MTDSNEARKAREVSERAYCERIEKETPADFLRFINEAWPGLPRTSHWYGLALQAFLVGQASVSRDTEKTLADTERLARVRDLQREARP